jgi:hypothetical protein
MIIPIEIINKILLYVGELNNNMIITQYHVASNKECYKINFNSDSIWKIKATIRMKQLYPVYPIYHGGFNNKDYIELYRFGIPHYQKELKRIGK